MKRRPAAGGRPSSNRAPSKKISNELPVVAEDSERFARRKVLIAAMAGLTEALAGGPLDVLCAGSFGGLPLSAMSLMYLLMALFHLPPWLRLAGLHPPTA